MIGRDNRNYVNESIICPIFQGYLVKYHINSNLRFIFIKVILREWGIEPITLDAMKIKYS